MTTPTQPPTEGMFVAPPRTRAAGNGIPVPPWGCTRCDSRWNGLKTAHCAACCQTFTTVSTFDKHRSGSHPNSTRHCVPPADAGLTDAGRAYPCWAQTGTYEREDDQ